MREEGAAMWAQTEETRRWSRLYEGTGVWFEIGHLAYIEAVVSTVLARGLRAARWDAGLGGDPAISPGRRATIVLDDSSTVTWRLAWDEETGWRTEVDEIPHSRPALSLVAEPHLVADAVEALRYSDLVAQSSWAGRNVRVHDVTLEAALATFRSHPAVLALHAAQARADFWWPAMQFTADELAAINSREPAAQSIALDQAHALDVTPMRYVVNAMPARHPDAHRFEVWIQRDQNDPALWSVQDAGEWLIAPRYLTADGHVAQTRDTYELDTAMKVARSAATLRRGGPNGLTAAQTLAATSASTRDPDRGVANNERDSRTASAAWPQPISQALRGHSTNPPDAAAQSARPSEAMRHPATREEAQR
jgi:hypothetical protein